MIKETITQFEDLPEYCFLSKHFNGFSVDFGDVVIRKKHYPNSIIAVYKLDKVYINQSRISLKKLNQITTLLKGTQS